MEEKKSNQTDVTEEITSQENDEALASFLSREPQEEPEKKKAPKNLKWILIAAGAVVALTVALVLLLRQPDLPQAEDKYIPAELTTSTDASGEHQAQVETDEKGEIKGNGAGDLLQYTPSDIKQIDVKNKDAKFSIITYTEKVKDDDGQESEKTGYTLKGYDGYELKEGAPDAVANDAAAIAFSSISNSGNEKTDFGFDHPRATVKVQYNDGTFALITVGDKAPGDAGSYITFGSEDTVYLVSDDAVDSFLYSVNDLISPEVTKSSDDSTPFKKLVISGTNFQKELVLAPNTDKAIKADYCLTAPKKMFADTVESSDIAGAIRGLYGEEVIALDPDANTLNKLGLSKPFAQIEAVYDDETIRLSASEPDSEGLVYLFHPDAKVVYSIQIGAIPWAVTSVEKLTPEVVLDLNEEAVKNITLTSGGTSYSFDVTTTKETQKNEDGEDEEVSVTTATCNGKKLNDENFSVFFQNLCGIKKVGEAEQKKGDVLMNLKISYNTGRPDDTLTVFQKDSTKATVILDGEPQSAVYKSYIVKLIHSAEQLAKGETVDSI